MNANLANAAIAFLSRVNLNAEEIPAFMAVKSALEEAANAGPELSVVEQQPEPELAEK